MSRINADPERLNHLVWMRSDPCAMRFVHGTGETTEVRLDEVVTLESIDPQFVLDEVDDAVEGELIFTYRSARFGTWLQLDVEHRLCSLGCWGCDVLVDASVNLMGLDLSAAQELIGPLELAEDLLPILQIWDSLAYPSLSIVLEPERVGQVSLV